MNATYLLSLLPLLACPLAMGLMMWLMMRGNKEQATSVTRVATGEAPADRPPGAMHADDRLAALRARLGEVEAQQTAIAAKLASLGAEDRPVGPHGIGAPEAREPVSATVRRLA